MLSYSNSAGVSFDAADYELTETDKEFVYEPAEDTHILLDALANEWKEIEARCPSICVEIGCGSGLIACSMSKHMKNRCSVLAVDINRVAADVTSRNACRNGVNVEVVVSDLLSCFSDRLRGNVDLLIFNPPYVPTDGFDEEKRIGVLARSWCGGDADGTAVIFRILPNVAEFLSPTGVFYLVAIASNRIETLLHSDPRLQGSIVLERKHGLERLFVLKFVRLNAR